VVMVGGEKLVVGQVVVLLLDEVDGAGETLPLSQLDASTLKGEEEKRISSSLDPRLLLGSPLAEGGVAGVAPVRRPGMDDEEAEEGVLPALFPFTDMTWTNFIFSTGLCMLWAQLK